MARNVKAIAAAASTAPSARSGPEAGEGRLAQIATITVTIVSSQASQEKYALATPAAPEGLAESASWTSLKPAELPFVLTQLTAVSAMISRIAPIPASVAPTTPKRAPLPIGVP